MNNLLKKTLLSVFAVSAVPVSAAVMNGLEFPISAAYADEVSSPESGTGTEKIELQSENIKFEFLTAVYNGKAQKPKISVSSGEKTLVEGTDFVVQYPDDCVNAGLKTLSVSGLGNYSGNFSATYKIEPMNVSASDVMFVAEADPCTYNGYIRTPEFRLSVNGVTVGDDDYTKKYSNNVNAGEHAVCDFTFTGNFTGKARTEFTISKAKHDDLDIEIAVDLSAANGAYKFDYDLSRLLPSGGGFGSPVYSPWDFPNDKPTVAFNELHCVVSDDASKAVITIPVLGSSNYEDFFVAFYFKNTQKVCPKLFISPIIREYNGEPVTEDDLENSGCYAQVNGQRVSGKWILWKDQSAEPHAALPFVCTFQPDDPAYESIDGIIEIGVNKVSAPEISVQLNKTQCDFGDEPVLTVSGVPDELADLLTIECSPSERYFEVKDYPSKTSLRYKVSLPYKSGIYTVTVSLPEDEYRLPVSESVEINLGNYVPPEQQVPDKVTTADELAKLIEDAPVGGVVTALGMRSLSEASLQAASQKRLTLEVKLNDTYSWILQSEKYSGSSFSLNLELGTAAIPSVLIEKIGGTAENSFTVSEKNFSDGAEIGITLKNTQKDKFANLFYYNSLGELEFCCCAQINSDKTVKFPITRSGKFVVITDNETKLFGDINNDCRFKLNDLVEFAYIYANGSATSDKLGKLDINGDGKIKLDDLIALANIYANSL